MDSKDGLVMEGLISMFYFFWDGKWVILFVNKEIDKEWYGG